MRTLQNWRSRAPGEDSLPLGRPRHSEAERRRALFAVRREIRAQGNVGWRPIAHALGETIPLRLVQESTRVWKRRFALRRARKREALRTHVEILGRDVLWSIDETQLGRTRKRKVEGVVVREGASQKIFGKSLGPPAKGEDVVGSLDRAKEERGSLPLVISSDNGPPFCNEHVEKYLLANHVIHLRNLPHTPEHNAWVERGIRELKEETGLESDTKIEDVDRVAIQIAAAIARLNDNRLRGSLGFQTASSFDAALPRRYNASVRENFFAAVQKELRAAPLAAPRARECRRAQREIIFQNLERLGLIRRTRGGAPYPAPKCEIIS